MASPALGPCPCPLLPEPEQPPFLQGLRAGERKKSLKRSAPAAAKPRRRPPPAATPEPRGTAQGSGRAAPPGKAGGGGAPADAGLRGPAEEPGPGRAGPPAGPRWRGPLAGSGGAGEERGPAGGRPRDPPGSGKPPRSGLLRLRLRRRSGAPRLLPDVRTIFEQPRDPRLRPETGAGHRFAAFALGRGWCDLCGRAVQQRALRCANCKYTCHQECRSLIQLDCSQQGQPRNKPSPENTLTQNCSQ
ncbi:unnamed protein product, partial [Lepidochelys olivacea]